MSAHLSMRDLLLVIIVCLLWAFNFIAGARGAQHFSPFLFMVLRMLVVLAVTLPFLRLPRAGLRWQLFAVCFLIGVLHFTTLFVALARSEDVFSIVVVHQTYIPMTVILAMFLLGETVGWRTLLAIFFSFFGVVLMGFDPLVLGQLDVLIIMLFSALFAALGSLYQRGLGEISVFNYQAWTALISLPFMLVFSLAFETDQLKLMRSAELAEWASLGYTALIASLIGHGLFFRLVQRNPVSLVMPYLLLLPVFGVMFGVTVWGDRPGWRLQLGSLIVLAGVLAVTVRARARMRSPHKA